MNSFNRLLSLYIDLFLIEKILYDYSRKMPEICILKENAYICNTEKNN